MKCETCNGAVEVIINWRNSKNVCLAAVCDKCAASIWRQLPVGSSAYDTFTIMPYDSESYSNIEKEVDAINNTLSKVR